MSSENDRQSTWVVRYENGEHESVWEEIRASKSNEPSHRDAINDVCHAMMKRARHNLELLSSRLRAKGWKVLTEHHRPNHNFVTQETGDIEKLIQGVEEKLGTIPIVLKAFWREVGGVDFVWNYEYRPTEESPKLCRSVPEPFGFLDPLNITGISDVSSIIDNEFCEEEEWNACIAVAPDFLHKINVSGGGPYAIYPPFNSVDPIIENMDPQGTLDSHRFVDYLRHAIKWAGFPLLSNYAEFEGVQELVDELTEGFLDF